MASTTKWRHFAFCVMCIAVAVDRTLASKEIIQKMSQSFGAALEQCKNELNLQDHIMQDFYNYWREDYELLNRDVGCAINCLASKMNLMGDDMTMHHDRAHEFAKSHGADDEVAKQLVTIIHDCEKVHEAIADHCSRTLEVAKCFRTKIHELKWAPSMETVLEEVMTDV